MAMAALSAAAAEGLKLTERVQLAPGATVEPQLFEEAKLAAFTPVTAMLKIRTDVEPGFDSLTPWVVLV
jgi:hypothetical protein